MSEPFLAEVMIFGFDFPPRGWSLCNGAILPIQQHQSLYSLLGTNYGGDGRTTFGLPDLRGRVPMHREDNSTLGHKGGEQAVQLTSNQIPGHGHAVQASSTNGDTQTAVGNVLAAANNVYHDASGTLTPLHAGTAGTTGGQAHDNMSPFLTLNYCIALQGLFPSRN